MTTTPKSLGGESLNGSWVDVSNENVTSGTSETFGLDGETCSNLKDALSKKLKSVEKLIHDASKESGQSSYVPSAVNSSSISPVSPCSPMAWTGESPMSVIEAMLLNQDDLLERSRRVSSEWLWDWSSRSAIEAGIAGGFGSAGEKQDQKRSPSAHPNMQSYHQLQEKKLSLRQWAVRRGLLSKDILSIFFLSNVLSLLLGAGIGYSVLIKRSL